VEFLHNISRAYSTDSIGLIRRAVHREQAWVWPW
jgi:hypothetical protein